MVPSERTKISAKVVDSSVRVNGATKSASAVLYIGESEFSTDLVGDSLETLSLFGVPSASVLLVDEHSSELSEAESIYTQSHLLNGGIEKWKVGAPIQFTIHC